jgi:SAM-dependent methyltransferase
MNKNGKHQNKSHHKSKSHQENTEADDFHNLFYAKYFDSLYNSGIQGFGSNYFHKSIESKWENRYPEKVLEIGASGGHHFKYIKLPNPSAVNYLASDIRESKNRSEMVEFKNGELKINWVTDDICKSKFKNQEFDRIVATCVFAHVDEPVLAINEVRRILKINGELAIGLPADPGFSNRLIKKYYSYPRNTRKGFPKAKLYNAISHKNSIFNLAAIFEEVFKNDQTNWRFHPFGIPSFDLNLFAVFRAKRLE